MNKTMNNNSSFNTTKAIRNLEERGWSANTIEGFLDGGHLAEMAIDNTRDMVNAPEWQMRWTLSNLLNLDELIQQPEEEFLTDDFLKGDEIERVVILPKAGIALNMNDVPVNSKDAITNKIIKMMNHISEDFIVIAYLDNTDDSEWVNYRINLTEKGTMNKPITKTPGNWKEETVERAQKSGKNGFTLFVKTIEQRREFLAWYYEQYPTKEGRLYINVIIKGAK